MNKELNETIAELKNTRPVTEQLAFFLKSGDEICTSTFSVNEIAYDFIKSISNEIEKIYKSAYKHTDDYIPMKSYTSMVDNAVATTEIRYMIDCTRHLTITVEINTLLNVPKSYFIWTSQPMPIIPIYEYNNGRYYDIDDTGTYEAFDIVNAVTSQTKNFEGTMSMYLNNIKFVCC